MNDLSQFEKNMEQFQINLSDTQKEQFLKYYELL